MKNSKQPIDSEAFGEGARHYFLDLFIAANGSKYLRIARSDYDPANDSYRRSQVVIFQEDLFFLVEGLSMLLSRSDLQLIAA